MTIHDHEIFHVFCHRNERICVKAQAGLLQFANLQLYFISELTLVIMSDDEVRKTVLLWRPALQWTLVLQFTINSLFITK